MAAGQISEADAYALGSVSDRYAVRSILGRGAFATVYLADDLEMGRPVVIKLLGSNRDSPLDADLFRAEVAATRRLEHPDIVRMVGDGITADQRPYLITEWIAGRSLAAVLKEGGPLNTEQAVQVARAIAEALAYVHRSGLVHRDLKPSNILIPGWPDEPQYDHPKLVDFGIAGRLGARGRTQAGMIYGTLRYMSPEQVNGQPQSAATDVYGFGLLLFEMLKGHPPASRSGDLTSLLMAIRDGIPAEELKDIDPRFAGLITRCLRYDAAERPEMGEVQALLRDGSEGGACIEPAPALLDVRPPVPAPPAAVAKSPSPSRDATGTTFAVNARPKPVALPARPVESSPKVAAGAPPAARRWLLWTAIATGVALLAVALILYFRPAPQPAFQEHGKIAPTEPNTGPKAGNPTPPAGNETSVNVIRFAAGLLLMAASIAVGFLLRTWLGSRSQVKSQAYELVFGSRARTDLTTTIALQLDELVSKLRNLDERILAGSVALMLNEYGSATDPKDRQAALMNVVALSEKLAVRLSPWYERYKEIIASAVAVMGGVSGLVTALNSILGSHKP
jgi:tRNA A-37 threonylcarbamoyl transferase component Bud32